MCRHLAYLGPAIAPSGLLLDPPHALAVQSWAPRRQTHGTVNADGFGLGWYPADGGPPLRHRGDGPVWGDQTFAELARSLTTPALLASVRSATAGTASGTAAAMPFRSGDWLFSHNGALEGWPDSAVGLVEGLDLRRLLRLEAMTDAAVLWAVLLQRLDAGVPAAEAVADVVARAADVCGGRLNLLLSNGRQLVATAHGASLCYRATGDALLVASEPLDDDPGWVDVCDASILSGDATCVAVTHL